LFDARSATKQRKETATDSNSPQLTLFRTLRTRILFYLFLFPFSWSLGLFSFSFSSFPSNDATAAREMRKKKKTVRVRSRRATGNLRVFFPLPPFSPCRFREPGRWPERGEGLCPDYRISRCVASLSCDLVALRATRDLRGRVDFRFRCERPFDSWSFVKRFQQRLRKRLSQTRKFARTRSRGSKMHDIQNQCLFASAELRRSTPGLSFPRSLSVINWYWQS